MNTLSSAPNHAQTAVPTSSSASPPTVVRSPPAVVGHSKPNDAPTVNGKSLSGPPAVLSSNGPEDHSRKSSVNLPTANGAPSNRPNMQFGAMATGEPPSNPQPNLNRVPSPIPPATGVTVTGGRPPSGPQSSSQLSFGSFAVGSDNPSNTHLPPQHLRRDSTHSNASDMNTPGRAFTPSGRGRGYNQNYNNHLAQSPSMMRGSPALANRNLSNAPPFQPGGQIRPNPQQPYSAGRSPHIAQASVQQHPYANGPPANHYAMYQQTPVYGIPQQDYSNVPGYPHYYQQPQYNYQPGYGGNAPPSPRHYPPTQPATSHHPFVPTLYQPSIHMQRGPSQSSDRPPSANNQSSSPAVPGPSIPPSTGSTSSSPAPGVRPERKVSKAIVIKTSAGEVVDIKNLASQSSTQPSRNAPPVVVSDAPVNATPPKSETPQPSPKPEVPASKEEEEAKRRQFQEKIQATLKGSQDVDAVSEDSKSKSADNEEEIAETPKDIPAAEPVADEDEEFERMIREMEESERKEEERQREYEAKKAAEKAIKDKEDALKLDEELRKAEREAEERESAKEKERERESSSGKVDEESKKLFESLGKNPFGHTSTTASPSPSISGPPTPITDTASAYTKGLTSSKHRAPPEPLKLETAKAVEPAQPTAAMQSLQSARFLTLKESVHYPQGFASPNPALNQGSKGRGQHYDMSFLLQFQSVYKDKPNVEWDKTLKEALGDPTDSARPGGGGGNRTPSGMGGRNASNRGPTPMQQPAMGQYRPLASGSTSEARFAISNARMGSGAGMNAFGPIVPGRGVGGVNFPMAAPSMSRTGSQNRSLGGNMSGRQGSRKSKAPSEKELAKTMPLTAGKDVEALRVSQTGWKPNSIVGAPAIQTIEGLITPDVVQRKVKSLLNKMTPEKFDKISNDILAIANQSIHENDGRTLRQVIQLTFEKACDEAHWGSMYAKFCLRMQSTMSVDIKDPEIVDRNGSMIVGGNLFRKYLLNRCQEEFEHGWENNLPKPEGGKEEVTMLSEEYYKAAAAKRKGLGLIQFIGELYKLGMLNSRIMHECVLKLLNSQSVPDESTIESLVKLLRTIGSTMQTSSNGPEIIDSYFKRIQQLMDILEKSPDSSRMYFMLLDTVDLRNNNWVSKDDAKGPKTITEIHQEAKLKSMADQEKNRAARANRPAVGGRGDARSFSGSPAQAPTDFTRMQVGMDDLKKLAGRTRTVGTPSATLGPSSLLSNRSGSRRGLGPPTRGEDSGQSSRTGTPPVKDTIQSKNAFDTTNDDVISPPSTQANSPELSKTALAKPES